MSSKLILICVFCAGTVLSRVAAAQDAANAGTPNTPVSDKFVGTWRLISIETIRPNGEIIYPFYGKQPDGMRKLVWERISSTLPWLDGSMRAANASGAQFWSASAVQFSFPYLHRRQ